MYSMRRQCVLMDFRPMWSNVVRCCGGKMKGVKERIGERRELGGDVVMDTNFFYPGKASSSGFI